jgi:hypothetical protein
MLEGLHLIEKHFVQIPFSELFEKLPLGQPRLLGQKVKLPSNGRPVNSQEFCATPQGHPRAEQTIQGLINSPLELAVGGTSGRLRKGLPAPETPVPHQSTRVRLSTEATVDGVPLARP